MGKKFVLIRKETDDSHHGKGRLLGQLGERWIFVDDFVASGHTRKRVIEKITEAKTNDGYSESVISTMVGQYMYVNFSDEGSRFEPFDEDWNDLRY
jgi:orotate phosphoribosyltransferase-like protein